MTQRAVYNILKEYSLNLADRVSWLFQSMESALHVGPSSSTLQWAIAKLDPFTGCGLQIMTLALHQNRGDEIEKDLEVQIRGCLENVDPQVRDVGRQVWNKVPD